MSEEPDSAPQKKDSFAALRFKDFRSYLGMRFFFTFAYQMQTTVIGFYIYQLTHSKVALAFIGLSEAIPAVGIALYGGYIADKYEKRKMLLLIFIGVFFSSLVMFTVTLTSMTGYIHVSLIVPIMYAMIFCNGIARAFYGPATFTIYAHSIPREVYPNASTWSSSGWQVASILGPMTAGFVYAFSGKIVPGLTGITANFIIILLFLLISLVLVFLLRKYPPVFVPKESIWKSLSAGINFVLQNKMMLYAMSLDLFSVFFGGAVALATCFCAGYLKGRPGRIGDYADGIFFGSRTNHGIDGPFFADEQTVAQPADCRSGLWLFHHWLRLITYLLFIAGVFVQPGSFR